MMEQASYFVHTVRISRVPSCTRRNCFHDFLRFLLFIFVSWRDIGTLLLMTMQLLCFQYETLHTGGLSKVPAMVIVWVTSDASQTLRTDYKA